MTKYIKIKEDGKELFRILDVTNFRISEKLEEIADMNILRGHGNVTRSDAIRLAVYFYHKQLKEEQNVNDETV
jgi:hypothetical protein